MAKKIDIKKVNLEKLKEYFLTAEEKKSALALSLIKRAEFLASTLDELEKEVRKEGTITDMSQGNYTIKRQNPALAGYNTTIKNYSAIIKQIFDMLPTKNEGVNDEDDFDKFCDDIC